MQTIEKAMHQPMPFTTGGQTITDRLTAAKHSLAGSQLGKTVCKATTEELMAPKKKHLDYLLHCTNEPNVSIPSMANLLIERTQNPNWTVVYKSLITIHNIMCYGNERFSQYLASCNTTFNLSTFLDKNSAQGYDMSQHVRRYAKYISEKISSYRLCVYDFCKVKRGREDGLLRTMNTDKLLKTMPILQNQLDALLEFQVTSGELNNGVINCSFILLFRDLIRLFACYNDGIINLLEKFFDMNKKQCREALDMYKAFLARLDKVADFLKVAESVGIDRGEIPDLTRAPASLLEALEAHLNQLEGGRIQPGANHNEQFAAAMGQGSFGFSSGHQPSSMDDSEQRKKSVPSDSSKTVVPQSFNPFASASPQPLAEQRPVSKPSDDLMSLFEPVAENTAPAAPVFPPAGAAMPLDAQMASLQLDPTNPFAQNVFTQPPVLPAPVVTSEESANTNPFLMGNNGAVAAPSPFSGRSEENRGYQWGDVRMSGNQQVQWAPVSEADIDSDETGTKQPVWNSSDEGSQITSAAESKNIDNTNKTDTGAGALNEAVNSVLRNPFGALQQNAQAFHAAGSTETVPPAHNQMPPFNVPPTVPSASTTQAGKFGRDLDSALNSIAENLTVSGKAATQGKPVQWNNQGGSRPSLVAPTQPLTQLPYTQVPVRPWGQMGAYSSQPALYPSQQMMGMYAQPGFVPMPTTVYGVPPQPQTSQPTTAAQSQTSFTQQHSLL
ncbi:unnamed protein product [Enterobius vermicularis]|uniref:ENTH domain-containing protein n=1 Tax=Enterobius vermicularis TaxID=51028 RepID=A0A0N4VGV2_ENTVE|nr:unnamed protein product [Enterobius vermicularis]